MKNLILYLFLVFIFLGCSEDQTKTANKKVVPPLKYKGVINWAFFSPEEIKNISFPIWLNDSTIEKRNIQKVNISIHDFDPSIDSTFTDTVPSTLYEVSYSKGNLNTVYVKEFFQEIAIEEQWFRYRHKKDSFGYTLPDVINNVIYEDNDFLPIFSTLQNAQHYMRLKYYRKDSSTVTYINTLSTEKEKHVFILDSVNWNVHFIDQKFEYPEKHTYYYGTPLKYNESFRIKDLVKKEQISLSKYFKNDCIYQQSTFNNGFENRRTFLYDEKGKVTGYVDSLIVEPNDFIESKVFKVKYKDNLPTLVSSFEANDSLYKTPIKEIRLSYVFDE